MADEDAVFEELIGEKTEAEDVISASQAARLSATLSRDDPPLENGDPIPPGWHVIFFPNLLKTNELARDGLLSVLGEGTEFADYNRMFAGTHLRFHRPLRVGEAVRQETEITQVTPKRGRSGRLIFAKQIYRVFGPDGLATEDERDIVLIEPSDGGDRAAARTKPAPAGATWTREITPDPVMLFRFSAVTFNPHRIHYDHPYVTEVEKFPGLVVHGPLSTILLLDLARDNTPGATMTEFHLRAAAPLFVDRPIRLLGEPKDGGKACDLWAATPDGQVAMAAGATFA